MNSSKNAHRNTGTRYFNVHTEAMGYLNGFEPLAGDKGGYARVTYCMLEGNPEAPERIYVSATVKCDFALEVLQHFQQQINDKTVPVFAGLRLAMFRARPFTFPHSHERSGQMDVNYSARLIKLMYLKVGNQVIQLRQPQEAPMTDVGVPSPDYQPVLQRPVAQRFEEVQQASAAEVKINATHPAQLFDQPPVVQLEKGDPNFEQNKDRLRQIGYRWANEAKLWVIAAITLNSADPRLQAQGQQLQAWGYQNPNWDGLTWEFPVRRRGNTVRQGNYQGSQQSGGNSYRNNGSSYQGRGNGVGFKGKDKKGYNGQRNSGNGQYNQYQER